MKSNTRSTETKTASKNKLKTKLGPWWTIGFAIEKISIGDQIEICFETGQMRRRRVV